MRLNLSRLDLSYKHCDYKLWSKYKSKIADQTIQAFICNKNRETYYKSSFIIFTSYLLSEDKIITLDQL